MKLRSRRASGRERLFSLLAVLAALLMIVPAAAVAHHKPGHPKATPAPVTIQLLNVSDWHGQIDPLTSPNAGPGGAWAISKYWEQERAVRPTLALTAGDDFGATPPLSSFFDEVPAVLAQRMMGIQVNTLGNHNFDRGIAHLQQMIDLAGAPTSAEAPGAPFRYVSANLRNVKANLTGVDPVAYFNVGGVKVAVIGITNEEAPTLVFPGSFGTIEVTDGVAAANKFGRIARQNGSQVVVVITHKGIRGLDAGGNAFGELVDFANDVDSSLIDVIVGDHTDRQFSATINGILVHENRSKGATYARTVLEVQPGKGGGVISKSVTFVTPNAPARTPQQLVAGQCPTGTEEPPVVNGQFCDPAILDMLIPYRVALAPILDVKIATATATFPRGGEPAVERIGEVALGNLITDGMRWRQGTDFAFTNGGSIRAPLPSGYAPVATGFTRPPADAPWDVLRGDVYTILPFANTVLRRNITGIQLWQALEHGVSVMPGADGRFPQVSGFKFTFNYALPTGCTGSGATRACVPNRVQTVTRPDGTPIPYDSTVYSVAMPNFINSGGDNYQMFVDGNTGANELLDAVVMEEYINHLGPVPALTPVVEARSVGCNGPCP